MKTRLCRASRTVPARPAATLSVVAAAFLACAAPYVVPTARGNPDDEALFKKGVALIDKDKNYEEGARVILEAARLAESRGDYISYWYIWKLARTRTGPWDTVQRLGWFEQAEAALLKHDQTDYTWKTLVLPNYVQLLCEKETALAQLGRLGQAFVEYSRAEDRMRELWPVGTGRSGFFASNKTVISIYTSLLLDRAAHQERAGRLTEAEATYDECIDVIRSKLMGAAGAEAILSKTLNNKACLMGLMGRDEEDDRLNAEAAALKIAGEDGITPAVNKLRRDARVKGPTEESLRDLAAKADALEEAGRHDQALMTRRMLASTMFLAGQRDAAFALFEVVLQQAASAKLRRVCAETLLWRAKARLVDDPAGAEEDLLGALDYYRREVDKPKEFMVYRSYAIVLHKARRFDEALAAINEALRLNAFMKARWLRPEALALKACILQAAGATEQADAVWAETLALLDALPDLDDVRRLHVMNYRLTYLAAAGRKEALDAYLAATRAFVGASELTEYQKQDFVDFDPAKVEPLAAGAVATAGKGLSLEPWYLSTRSRPSAPARAWLWLINDSAADQRGTLTLASAGRVAFRQTGPAQWEATLSRAAGDGAATASPPLTLPPGGVLTVRAVYEDPPADAPESVSVAWSGSDATTSRWDVVSDAEASGLEATIHASLVRANPFFSIPLYHEIDSASPRGGAPLNFRFRASAPCRVEIYAADDSALLAIDADGNGSYGDPGDLLCRDEDRNGFPDVAATPAPVVAYVFPATGQSYDRPLDVGVDVSVQETWKSIGSDRLLGFGRGNK
jgi:tetratricopeptide (TPR) repeat protein